MYHTSGFFSLLLWRLFSYLPDSVIKWSQVIIDFKMIQVRDAMYFDSLFIDLYRKRLTRAMSYDDDLFTWDKNDQLAKTWRCNVLV